LILIFSPLATVRAPAVLVVSCANAMEAEKANSKTASMREENILNFGITINNSLLIFEVFGSRKRARRPL